MGSATDKAQGFGNQAAGKVKEAAGKVVGNDRLAAEGQAQQGLGKGQEFLGDVKSTIKKAVDKI